MGRTRHKLIIIHAALIILFSSCTLLPTRIKEPILLGTEPRISFRYEYESIAVSIPYIIEGAEPENISVRIVTRINPLETLLELTFMPGEELSMMLPVNILSQDPLGNLAVISPGGDDYEIKEILFSIDDSPSILLPSVLIRQRPYLVSGHLIERASSEPVSSGRIDLIGRNQNVVFGSTVPDSTGYFRFDLQQKYGADSDFYLLVNMDKQFPDRVVQVDFIDKEFYTRILLGMSQAGIASGAAYQVLHEHTPFRDGPENGADIQFFLTAGDLFVVTKVAGNRLFGFVEMPTRYGDGLHTVYGWVRENDVEVQE